MTDVKELMDDFLVDEWTDEHGDVRLTNTDDGYGDNQRLEDVTDENGNVDPDWVMLGEDTVEASFYVRGDGYGRSRGPAFDVKIHNVYSECRRLEDKLDIEIPDDIDMEGWIWNDTVENERDYFTTWINELFPALDTDRFTQVGRQGGHLVYVKDSLSLSEAHQLEQLAERLPEWVKGIGTQIAMEYARYALERVAEDVIARQRKGYVTQLKVAATLDRLSEVEDCLEQIRFLDQADVHDWALDTAEAAAF